jgi:hypothetical protein
VSGSVPDNGDDTAVGIFMRIRDYVEGRVALQADGAGRKLGMLASKFDSENIAFLTMEFKAKRRVAAPLEIFRRATPVRQI